MPTSPISLKSFPNAADALGLIDNLYIDFKKVFQRNPIPSLTMATVSRPSLHGEGKAFAVNQYGKMPNIPKPKNNFGGAMAYKPTVTDAYEVIVRWDMNDAKANKDADWLNTFVNKK